MGNCDQQIEKVFEISSDNMNKLENLSSKIQENNQVYENFQKLKKEFTSFRENHDDSDAENEIKKMMKSINEESQKFENFKQSFTSVIKELENSQNTKLNSILFQVEEL